MHIESASGVVLLAAAAVALAAANSPLGETYLGFWQQPFGFRLGGFHLEFSVQHWINDFLMAIFFFVIGLEVKREMVLGELREFRRAALPLAAALGGMVVPAAIYLLLQHGAPGERGWGIPMATDIAFVVGCLAILGPASRVSLRIMLLSLAIADDIGAILVIAIGYTGNVDSGRPGRQRCRHRRHRRLHVAGGAQHGDLPVPGALGLVRCARIGRPCHHRRRYPRPAHPRAGQGSASGVSA